MREAMRHGPYKINLSIFYAENLFRCPSEEWFKRREKNMFVAKIYHETKLLDVIHYHVFQNALADIGIELPCLNNRVIVTT